MSLIEVLVALAILAGGLVGAVALQTTAKKSSFDAQQRSLASSLAQDIIERIRVNDSSSIEDYEGTYGAGALTAPTNRCNNIAAPCGPTALATNDVFEWEQKLLGANNTVGGSNVGGLVNPRGCISHTNNRVTVLISWEGRMAISDGASETITDADKCGTASTTRRQIAMEVFVF